MFALALISASLVPGSTGSQPMQKLENEIRHARRRLVKKEYLDETGQFAAPIDATGKWKLKDAGTWGGDLKCRRLFQEDMNQHAKRLGYFALGCAMKPSKSSGSKNDRNQWTRMNERWFMLDLKTDPKCPKIRYYKPYAEEAQKVVDVEHSNIITPRASFYTPKSRPGYKYPVLGFSVKTQTQEPLWLRVIFRSQADRASFKMRLLEYTGTNHSKYLQGQYDETDRLLRALVEQERQERDAAAAASSGASSEPEEKLETPPAVAESLEAPDKPEPKQLTAVQLIRLAFLKQEKGLLDHRGVLKALEGNEAFDNYIGSSGSSPRVDYTEPERGVAGGDCAQYKKEAEASNFRNLGGSNI